MFEQYISWFKTFKQKQKQKTKNKKKHSQTSILDIYIITSHLILLHISVLKGHLARKQTTALQNKSKLATFIRSWRGLKIV